MIVSAVCAVMFAVVILCCFCVCIYNCCCSKKIKNKTAPNANKQNYIQTDDADPALQLESFNGSDDYKTKKEDETMEANLSVSRVSRYTR